MGCPVHIWAPLMASLVPVARVARDRLAFGRARRSAPPAGAVRPVHRFPALSEQIARGAHSDAPRD